MSADFSLMGIAFNLSLFVLLLIKLRSINKEHVIPALKNFRQQADEKRFTLQEQHAILITQKKQLATQFLQQEKQLALLTAKLENWYLAWVAEEAKKKKEFEEREKKIHEEIRRQDKTVAYKRACQKYTEQMLQQAIEQLQSNPQDANAQRFFERAVENIQALSKPQKEVDADTDA